MKFPDRFWIETTPRLTDVALAALLTVLLRGADDLPPGVIRARAIDLEETRFAWAASQIADEIGAAPGITVDGDTGLAVVWELASRALPQGPGPALAVGRLLGATQSSWTKELAHRIGTQLTGKSVQQFLRGLQETIAIRKLKPQRPRPRSDRFEPDLLVAKRLERHLRAEFEGVEDRGERPGAADRIAIVNALGLGYETSDILQALHGRAEKCRRSRMWQATDTAEAFLRIAWVFAEKRRIEEALRTSPAVPVPDTAIIRGPGGTFVAGRQVFAPEAVPIPAAPDGDGANPVRDWLNKQRSE